MCTSTCACVCPRSRRRRDRKEPTFRAQRRGSPPMKRGRNMDLPSRLDRWENRSEWPLAVIAVVFLVAYSLQVLAQPRGVTSDVLRAFCTRCGRRLLSTTSLGSGWPTRERAGSSGMDWISRSSWSRSCDRFAC